MLGLLLQIFLPVHLQCEHREAPLGVDVVHPAFSWQVEAKENGYMQGAYQLQITSDTTKWNTGWNSGKVNSDASSQIIYTGKPLKPAQPYYWRVRVWNTTQKASVWSQTATFTTALTDWSHAQWIGYEELPDSMRLIPDSVSNKNKAVQRAVVPYFQKTFTAKRKINQALLFISGLGQYECEINGNKIGNSFLAPGWTYYDKRVLFNTYNVTKQLQQGHNTMNVIVGNGFYYINRERYHKLTVAFGYPKMICQLLITYEDGTTSTIVSDTSWQTKPSPITYSSIYGGEDYDARQEQNKNWKPALHVTPPKGKLEPEQDYPVGITQELLPQKILPNNVYDFGQNASGIIEIKIKGQKGQTIKITPAELLTNEQLPNQKATGKPYYFSYTCKGEGIETWRPRFTYYGFRYVQVEGGTPESIKFLHTSNTTPENGNFSCSNELFNQIYRLIKWAIKSNMQSVLTDCPHREKLSWLEQDYLMGNSIQFNYDIYLLYKKLVADMMDAQTPEGLVPDIAPEYVYFNDHGFGFRDSPEWGSASVILPWLLYKWYGDKDVMRSAYPMMKRYVQYLESRSKDHILDYGLGDWFDNGPARPGVAQLTPKSLTATAIWYYDCSLLAKMATILKTNDADALTQQAAAIKAAFHQRFFKNNVYSTGSQTAMAMPLCVGLTNNPAVLQNLIDSINSNGGKLTAGDVGFHFLVQALQEGGASQLIYDMNSRSDVPGYGYQLAKGATALTESWPALAEVSNNHLMLGHIMEWFYNGLGGIRQTENGVGYKDIIIHPEIVGDIKEVHASYNTIYGKIVSEWKREGDEFSMHVSIPPNTTATVYIPKRNSRLLQFEAREIKAGDYYFEVN